MFVARCRVLLLLVLVGTLGAPTPAWSEEGDDGGLPVQAVIDAFEGKDEAAMKALQDDREVDAWLLVERLCLRRAHDAAKAYASGLPGPAFAALPAYVERRKKDPLDAAFLEQTDRVFALKGERDPRPVVKATEPLPEAMDSVLAIFLAHWRANALQPLRRFEDARAAAVAGAKGAAEIGWLVSAAQLQRVAGGAAWYSNDRQGALAHWEEAIAFAKKAESAKEQMLVSMNLGVAYRAFGDPDKARTMYESAIAAAKELGDELTRGNVLNNLGALEMNRGRFEEAYKAFRESAEIKAKFPDRRNHAMTLSNMGVALVNMGRVEEALPLLKSVLATQRDIGDKPGESRTLNAIGRAQLGLYRYDEALENMRASVGIAEAANVHAGVAAGLSGIAAIHLRLLEFEKADAEFARAEAIWKRLGDAWGQLSALQSRAEVRDWQARYGEALAMYEDALRRAERLDAVDMIGSLQQRIASLLLKMGRLDDVIRRLDLAEAAYRKTGSFAALSPVLSVRGHTLMNQGEFVEAQAVYERILELPKLAPHNRVIATLLVGSALGAQGKHEEALKRFLESQELAKDGADALDLHADAQFEIGMTYSDMGRYAEAEKALRSVFEMHADPRTRVDAHVGLGHVLISTGRPAEALESYDRAIAGFARAAHGLVDEERAGLRDTTHELYASAVFAASLIPDPARTVHYLELSRARAFADTLRVRETLREALVPRDVARSLHAAEERVADAEKAVTEARRAGKRKDLRAALKRLEEARGQETAAFNSARREARRALAVIKPEPASLADVQALLRKGDALVYYELSPTTATGVVVTPDAARIVDLGDSDEIIALVDGALVDSDPYVDEAGLAKLAARLIEPLALGEDVMRVLVSPTGRFGFLPFAAVLPGRDVAYLPSASVLAMLRKHETSGATDVLGIGDPDYTGTKLPSLPATRAEVEAVAGTRLLGKEATTDRARDALAREGGWRAVHIACHGIVDAERPLLSHLALTGGALYARDVFQMKIPAELAVLSACETGRGRVYLAEGISGLMRAFMFAGPPRVICSLWKVDDEATGVLMKRFYELWNAPEGKRLGAAAALRAAQEHVRAQPKWKHPKYWSAWVLWGLPD